MIIEIALVISVILQFGGFFITISLIKKTKFSISWILISTAFLLMAIRRLSELITLMNSEPVNAISIINIWIAVIISALMFISSFYIRQIFIRQSRINKIQKENEAIVLSAIIRTEEKERKKFAKELHDGLGPILSSIKMAISAIDKKLIGKQNIRIIENTEVSVDNAITTIKEISNNLSPQILEGFGLEKAIKTFSDSIITKKSIKIIQHSNLNGKRLDYNIEVVLYRIICELISNTLKYASASNIEISLYDYQNKFDFFYVDNGIGFDQKKVKRGMGLSNIHSRVKSLDGEMEIKTNHKQGFFIKIILPL